MVPSYEMYCPSPNLPHQQDWYSAELMERLARLRLSAGLSKSQIAQACSVLEQVVSQWEQSPCPDITLAQIAEYAMACGYVPFDMTYGEIVNEQTNTQEACKTSMGTYAERNT